MMRVATIPAGRITPEELDDEVSEAVAHLLRTSGIDAKAGPWHPLGMALPLDVPTVLDIVSLIAGVAGIAGAVTAGGGYTKQYLSAKRQESALRYAPSMRLQVIALRDCTVTMRQLAYVLPAIYDVVNNVRPGVLLKTALVCSDPPVPQCEIHLENVPVTGEVRDKIVARLKPEGSQARAIRQTIRPGRRSSVDIQTEYWAGHEA